MAIAETAATFIGITNENEFYSHHYLSEMFQGDIKETLERWRAQAESEDEKVPYVALRRMSREFLQFRGKLERERRHDARIALQRAFFQRFLAVLGCGWAPRNLPLEDGDEIPVLATVGSDPGIPELVCLGAYDATYEGLDPLALTPHRDQFHGDAPPPREILHATWNDIITRRLYAQDHPPRWVLLLSDAQCLLIDRSKWSQNRLLRFDFAEILGRRDDTTLKATAALLHRESLVPGSGVSLLDNLDENSHRHAFAVSNSTSRRVRSSVTPRSSRTPTARATAWSTCVTWSWCGSPRRPPSTAITSTIPSARCSDWSARASTAASGTAPRTCTQSTRRCTTAFACRPWTASYSTRPPPR